MSSKNNVCFFNGESANSVPVDDRGLSYGHGLFETIRLSNGSAPLWNYHFSRLTGDAAKLGIKIDGHLLQGYLEQLIMACPADGVIKVIVTAGSGGRGYRSSSLDPNYLLQWFPLSDYPVSHQTLGIALKHCQHPLSHSPQLAGIKHLNRLDQVVARSEWEGQYSEGLMLDQQGNVVEAVSSNLFFYREGVWLTPKLDQCGVKGVMRQYLMEELMMEQLIGQPMKQQLPSSSNQVEEVTCSLDLLLSSEEVFVCNSIIGIWPVLSLESRGSWPLGQHTVRLQNSLYKALPHYESSL